MNVFISAPKKDGTYNKIYLDSLAGALLDAGHVVYNPANEIPPRLSARAALTRKLLWICRHADGVLWLPHSTPEQDAERTVAMACGIPTWTALEDVPGYEKWQRIELVASE